MQIEPAGIVTRGSTDVFADGDPNILHAIRLIRKHACDGLRVQDVLKSVPVSRTVLDHEFKRLLGRTAHDEIGRIQLQRVAELLTETDWPLATVADRCGFRHAEYMTFVFKRRHGISPKEYRRAHQPRPNEQAASPRKYSTRRRRGRSLLSPGY
jgi:LacI family transcriptional regulator